MTSELRKRKTAAAEAKSDKGEGKASEVREKSGGKSVSGLSEEPAEPTQQPKQQQQQPAVKKGTATSSEDPGSARRYIFFLACLVVGLALQFSTLLHQPFHLAQILSWPSPPEGMKARREPAVSSREDEDRNSVVKEEQKESPGEEKGEPLKKKKSQKMKKKIKVPVRGEEEGEYEDQEMVIDWDPEWDKEADAEEAVKETPEYKMLKAAADGKLKTLKKFVEQIPDYDTVYDNDGKNVLYLACEGGHLKLVEYLLGKGARANMATEAGNTPLHAAAMSNSKPIAELLVEAGAQVNARSKVTGYTPLHKAVLRANKHLVLLLLEHGAEVDAKGDDGVTPLDVAVMEQFGHLQRLLKKKGAKGTGRGMTEEEFDDWVEEHEKAPEGVSVGSEYSTS